MARRATFIEQMQAEHENLLIVDAGNALSGSQGLTSQTEGSVMIASMSLMGYDAMALGRLDLGWGASTLRERMAESTFPLLSANVVISETGELFAQPYIVLDVDGHSVGLVGLTEPLGVVPPRAGDEETLLVRDPVEYGFSYVDAVAQETDIVIVLSHMGQALDELLAEEVPAVDVIIGGRDGTILHPAQYGDKGAIITQVGTRGQLVGSLDIQFDAAGQIEDFYGNMVLLDEDYADDPDQLMLLERYQEAQRGVTPGS